MNKRVVIALLTLPLISCSKSGIISNISVTGTREVVTMRGGIVIFDDVYNFNISLNTDEYNGKQLLHIVNHNQEGDIYSGSVEVNKEYTFSFQKTIQVVQGTSEKYKITIKTDDGKVLSEKSFNPSLSSK